MQRYITEVIQYNVNTNLQSKCNAISFTNTGTTNLYVNKYLLTVGQTLSIDGNAGELDVTEYKINFPANTGECSVIRKTYL